MPVYLYRCEKCEDTRETVQPLGAEAPMCCDSSMERVPAPLAMVKVSNDGVLVKSKGYKEDYAKEYQRSLET